MAHFSKSKIEAPSLEDPHLSDDYEFKATGYDDLMQELKLTEQNSRWIDDVSSKEITLESIDGPLMADEVAQKTRIATQVVFDTAQEGTHLIAATEAGNFCLRECARSSLLETAKLNGSSLGRMSPYVFAQCVNWGLSVARGKSLLLERYGKVAAMLSDGYEVMEMPILLAYTKNSLNKNFGESVFNSGYTSHSFTEASWELTDAKSVIQNIYQDALMKAPQISHAQMADVMPVAHFYSSDTGGSKATLVPEFKLPNGVTFRFTDGIAVKHEKSGEKTGLDRYNENIDDLFAQFQEAGKVITELASIEIRNPVNCVIELCKKFGIAKRYGSAAVDEIEIATYASPILSAHDIYISLQTAVLEAQQRGASRQTINQTSETMARILKIKDWKDYDVSGVSAWK
jgi:hypothetical protein